MKLKLSIAILLYATLLNKNIAQQTKFEASNGTETATYFECINFYKLLDKQSPLIAVKEMGVTDAGYPLHTVLICADKSSNPEQWHKQGKVVFLINNGIHPGEPDGIDASMMITRDIANGKIKLPTNVAIAIIPVYNIGGALNRGAYSRANQNGPAEYGFRGNAQNLDLNRDFTKCDSRNAKAFAQIFHYINPDVFLDTHVSDGADYQHTMTLLTTQYDKLSGSLGKWLKQTFEPAIYSGMKAKSWDLVPYVDFEGTDFSAMEMFYDPPRYSTGYTTLFNTIGFMSETHMLKPYKQRVSSTYDLIATIINQSGTHATEILQERKKAIGETVLKTSFPLGWKIDKSAIGTVDFKGYERDSSISKATGLTKMFYNHNKPFEKKIKYYNSFTGEKVVTKPAAYIIPQGWHDVIDLLKLNKVQMRQFKKDTVINASFYKIMSYDAMPRPYEKHHRNSNVKTTVVQEKTKFLKGDYLIYLNQPANRFLIEMLEPTGDDSYFSWNFFDAILQQKEWYSDYRWEDRAAEYLEKDTALQARLQEKKNSDPTFAKSSSAILAYIYRNSPWYEKAHMRYPVYRIEMNNSY